MKNGIFGFIRVLDSISEKGLVAIDLKKCMRYLNKHSGCTICLDTCPAGAITLEDPDEIITVDGFLCTGCGICVNTCPNPVFSLEDMDAGTIANGLEGRDRAIISCHRSTCDIQIPCLGFVSEALLLHIISQGTGLELNISACRQCENKTAYDIILGHVSAANSVLQGMGKGERVIVKEDGPVLEPAQSSFTRKFMSRFSGADKDAVAVKDTGTWKNSDAVGNTDTVNDPVMMKTRQSMFIDALRRMDPAPGINLDTGKVPLGSIHVLQSCTGCGMCAPLCPVDALSIPKNDDFILEFRPDLCTGCGLCGGICPGGSISLDEKIDLDEVLKGEPKDLINIPRARCGECGEYYVRSGDCDLCGSCKKNREIEESFFSR